MDTGRELERGREKVRRRAWSDAFRSLSLADEAGALGIDDLESLALAAYMVGRDTEYLDALERAHHACLEGGNGLRAARFAFWIGLRLLLRGDMGPATGWLARARRLVEAEDGPSAEEGYLLLPEAERELAAEDHRAAEASASRAVDIGERFEDRDLTAAARHVQGRAVIARGAVEDGLALLDEAMVAVTADEVSPLLTGLVYCSVIEACQRVCAFRRAREWTTALAKWCERQPQMVAFTSTCRVYRAEVMRWHGEWPRAMEEARRARQPFARGIEQRPPSAAFYQQAEIHRLRGERGAAEEGYREANEWGRDPQPGLALLRLSQGRTDAALVGITRSLDATSDPLVRARLLPAYVEIALAAEEPDDAREALRELEAIAERFDADVLEAMAAGARGAVELARGDAEAALRSLRRAREAWRRVEAPYPLARVRELLGEACRRMGDDDGARLELEAARAEYERLSAAPDLARLEASAGRSSTGPHHPLTPRQFEVLRLVASGKTNKEIAARLVLSERTVERHVSDILRRLRVSSRVAATAYAYRHDLIPRD